MLAIGARTGDSFEYKVQCREKQTRGENVNATLSGHAERCMIEEKIFLSMHMRSATTSATRFPIARVYYRVQRI